MNNSSAIDLVRRGYGYLIIGASGLQSVFLLVLRLHWGWQFFVTGKGKLAHIDKIVGFFHDLGIPYPTLNAYLAGMTECFGGLCLFFGLASRLTTIPLMFTMLIAYLTAEHEALHSFFSDPDKFTSADPFLFLLTALIVFLFGPGVFSVDEVLKRIFTDRQNSKVARTTAVPVA